MRRFDEFSHNIIDSHIHVGWYDNFYFSAQEILNIVSKLKISKCFISSMSGWKKGTEFASNELLNVTKSNPHIFYPLLWVNPLEEYVYEITAKLAKKTFHGLKIHPNADGYHASMDLRLDRIERLRNIGLPIFAHTGNPGCLPSDFIQLIKRFKDIPFVLYHGRPVNEAIEVTLRFDNVYIETAFMEPETFQKALATVGPSKILFGSDLPLDAVWYPKEDIAEKYKSRVESYLDLCSDNDALKIFRENILGIVNIDG